MSKQTKIRLFVIMAAIILFFVSYWYIQTFMNQREITDEDTTTYAKAYVTDLLADDTQADSNTEGMIRGSQEIKLKITSGSKKGETFTITNYMSAMYNINCQKGTKIIVRLDKRSDGNVDVAVYNYNREGVLFGEIFIFMALLCIIGGRKGLMSLVSLLYTLLNVFFLLIPALYFGAPVIPTTIGIIVITNLVCFIMIDGINKKTICAALGTTTGVVFAGIFAFAMGKLAHITGFQTNEAEELLLVCTDYGLKITHLFTAGILVSALGAVMDVSMSISSSVNELHAVNPDMQVKDLFKSGMNIGRDAMGTMSNTLILAFVGSSLNLIIMIYSYHVPLTQLWATDLVAREIIQGISGSIGIVMTVPFVAFFGSVIMKEKREIEIPKEKTSK
ncbi:MAG: YibE/F family protein [Velocimicrobium sp.]